MPCHQKVACHHSSQRFAGFLRHYELCEGPCRSCLRSSHASSPAFACKDAVLKGLFPPDDGQLEAIEDLKGLVVEDHLLAVPDERAAIEAANAWMTGEPARGLPYEGGAGTSKIAMGGGLGPSCQQRRSFEDPHVLERSFIHVPEPMASFRVGVLWLVRFEENYCETVLSQSYSPAY